MMFIKEALQARYLQLVEAEKNGQFQFVLQNHLRGRGIDDLTKEEANAILKASDKEILRAGVKAEKIILDNKGKVIPATKSEEEKRKEIEEKFLPRLDPLERALLRTLGCSYHDDLRFEMNGHLIGWSIVGQRWGLEFLLQPIVGMMNRKVRCETKARQPKEWLKMKGAVERGEVGATRWEYGFFRIRDAGKYTQGFQSPLFHEYFLHGDLFKDLRFVVRGVKLPRIDPETKKPLKGQFEIIWNGWIPFDQTPYVIKRGRRKGKFPPKDFIPIPKYWIEKNKNEFDDWLKWVEEKWKENPKGKMV